MEENFMDLYFKTLTEILVRYGVKRYMFSFGKEREQTACIIPINKGNLNYWEVFDFERSQKHNKKIYNNIERMAKNFAPRITLHSEEIDNISNLIIDTFYNILSLQENSEYINLIYRNFEEKLAENGIKRYMFSFGKEREQSTCMNLVIKEGLIYWEIFDFERSQKHNIKEYDNIEQVAKEFAKRVTLHSEEIDNISNLIIDTYYQILSSQENISLENDIEKKAKKIRIRKR